MLLRESAEDMGLPRNQQGWGKFNCEKLLAEPENMSTMYSKSAEERF